MTEPGTDLDDLVATLTLEEKASLLSGSDHWQTRPLPGHGVAALWLSDGPHGVRRETSRDVSLPATSFPTASSLGATWDRDLVHRVAAAIGREAAAQGVHVMLGPGINIKRTPLCGRNFEYFSEDPVLSGEVGGAYVLGMQSTGVAATVKHYAANNQENGRHWVSSEVDERTLREVYLAAFERVVATAAPRLVMSSYNRVNGVHASQHRWLLTDVLRDELGFDGAVVSDWESVHDRVAALRAGLDLQMPGVDGSTDREVVAAVRAGELDETVVDRSVLRLLRLVAAARDLDLRPLGDAETAEHDALAVEAAVAGTVLLTNDGVLPLDAATPGRVALVGRFAAEPRIQGRGSAHVNARHTSTALDALTAALGDRLGYVPGYPDHGTTTEAEGLRAEAVALAAGARVAVVMVGLPDHVESEGYDRSDLELPVEQVDLLDAVLATGTPTVVVLVSGSAVRMGEWHDRAAAVVQAWLAGQGGGLALAQVLLGDVDPGGRLGETFPLRIEDTPTYLSYPGERGTVRYSEGVHVGHRWYDAKRLPVRYAFGHGLSYTRFAWSGLQLSGMDAETGRLTVSVEVENVGDRPGTEVVQVYVSPTPGPVARPERELKAFEKLRLAPGERRTVTLELGHRDFAWYDVTLAAWVRTPGTARIEVGASSRDLRLTAEVDVLAVPAAAVVLTDAELEVRTLAWSAAESERRRVG